MNDRAGIEIAAQPLLEWPQFQLAGTPACTGRGQEITIFLEPEIEVAVGVQTLDRPSEKTLQLVQKLVDLGQLLAGIGEEILDRQFGMMLAHIHRQDRKSNSLNSSH